MRTMNAADRRMNERNDGALFASESIWRVLLTIAPPVMFAQLVQALYNIVDSYFVGKFSPDGLTALSIVYPVQFLIIAFAVGTGIGVNTFMASLYAQNRMGKAFHAAGCGSCLAVFMWILFAVFSLLLLKGYVDVSTQSESTRAYAMTYGRIVCAGSLPLFLESVWTKVHQAGGNMRLPMIAQVVGAAVNIVLDPILIWGWGGVSGLGVAGAAYATVIGQLAAALIVCRGGLRRQPRLHAIPAFARTIWRLGFPQILMLILMTFYILVLNVILAKFSDAAVTVLGLYYRLQTFFFIPLFALQTCIVPVLSYNYARKEFERCRRTTCDVVFASLAFMLPGMLCFLLIPACLLDLFSPTDEVLQIGVPAFRIIGLSFPPAVLFLTAPIFFQAIGETRPSVLLSLLRQIFCLIPIFHLLSFLGVGFVWIAFPVSEIVTGTAGILLYFRHWKRLSANAERRTVARPPGGEANAAS